MKKNKLFKILFLFLTILSAILTINQIHFNFFVENDFKLSTIYSTIIFLVILFIGSFYNYLKFRIKSNTIDNKASNLKIKEIRKMFLIIIASAIFIGLILSLLIVKEL